MSLELELFDQTIPIGYNYHLSVMYVTQPCTVPREARPGGGLDINIREVLCRRERTNQRNADGRASTVFELV